MSEYYIGKNNEASDPYPSTARVLAGYALAAGLLVGVIAPLGNGLVGDLADNNYGSEQAKTTIEQGGYNHAIVTSTDEMLVGTMGCSWLDAVKYEALAKTPSGEIVGVVVCKGLFGEPSIIEDQASE